MFTSEINMRSYCNCRQYIDKHNSISDINVYFLHCFVRHGSAVVMAHPQVDYFS